MIYRVPTFKGRITCGCGPTSTPDKFDSSSIPGMENAMKKRRSSELDIGISFRLTL